MNNPNRAAAMQGSCDLKRRTVLTGLLAGYAASYLPWACAQSGGNAAHGAFLSVSKILTGRDSLDAGQATRLYDALAADDARFATDVQELNALIEQRRIDPLQLQQVLDSEKPPLAALPQKIVSAWFLGVVGSGAKARVLAYETALNAVIVADVLRPPTYCYGGYGSWTKKPTQGASNGQPVVS